MADVPTVASSRRALRRVLLGAVILLVVIAAGGRRLFYSLGEMNRRALAAIDVGSLEAEWFRYERDNRVAAQTKLQPSADWRILNPAKHVWVLNELAPGYRVNDDTAANLRPDGFRDPWGLIRLPPDSRARSAPVR